MESFFGLRRWFWSTTSECLNSPHHLRAGTELLVVLNYEIDFLCVIFWGMLWVFVAHAILRFVYSGTSVSKYHAGIDMTIEVTFTLSFGGLHTPRTCLLRSVGVVSYGSPDKDCDVDREMSGWSWRNGLLSSFMTIIVGTDVSDQKKVQGTRESCRTFCLKRNDVCFFIPMFILSKTKTRIESQEHRCIQIVNRTRSHIACTDTDICPHITHDVTRPLVAQVVLSMKTFSSISCLAPCHTICTTRLLF